MRERLEAILRRFGADSGTIHTLERGRLVLRAEIGLPPAVAAIVAEVPLGKGMAGLAAERNEPVSSCNIQTDRSGDVRPGARATGLGGAIVVPIRDAAGRAVGALGIGVAREHTYSEEETRQLLEEARALATA
jgi:putative methionine-R-sulfoxide reductase with GAF domain